MTVVYDEYFILKNMATGDRLYRAVLRNGMVKRVSRKNHTRARDAVTYGKAVASRFRTFPKTEVNDG